MFYTFFLVVIGVFLGFADAHTHLYSMTINGTTLGRGECIRPYQSNFNFPVRDPDSEDLVCRTTDMSAESTETCGIVAGSTITIEWHEENDRGSRGIEGEHWGPCIVYMAPLESNGKGQVWFKIFELGYNPDTKDWCIDVFNRQNGKLDIEIPADIKQGGYLMRTEVIALHEAERQYGDDKDAGAQYYPNCAQVYIIGNGAAEPKGVAIPGVYEKSQSGIHFDLWNGYKSYPIPGPELYTAGSVTLSSEIEESSEADSSSIVDEPPEPRSYLENMDCIQKRKLRKRRNRRRQLNVRYDL